MHRLTIVRVSAAYAEHNWSKEELAGSRGDKKKGAGFLWRAGDNGRAVASRWRSSCRWRNRLVGFIQAASVLQGRTSHGAAFKVSAKGVKKHPSQAAVCSLLQVQKVLLVTVTVMEFGLEATVFVPPGVGHDRPNLNKFPVGM